jgi:hypothetical protein
MRIDEAKQILSKNGYIVENSDTISFEQEAKNIVYSYGTDEYGLDVDQIVKILEDASKFKYVDEGTNFIHQQFTKITGLTMWEINEDEKLEAALYDMCKAVYDNNRQGKPDDKLGEAKQILKNNGYLVESTKTEIDCSNWHWVKSMSSYNNNYYYDTLSDVEFYLEECDEDYGDYLYYACDKSGKKLKYLGYTNREGSVENCEGRLVLDPSMPT